MGSGGQEAGAGPEMIAYVNGKRHALPRGRGEATLLSWLRALGLTGTKLGCGEGGCGACTVMVSGPDPQAAPGSGALLHRAVNACLYPLYAVDGCHVVTVEGIGDVRGGLHPVQERLSRAHGSQCGFCTPGFVMSVYALMRSCPNGSAPPTMEQLEEAISGNLCRCTGYRPILDAFRPLTADDGEGGMACALGADCCRNGGAGCGGGGAAEEAAPPAAPAPKRVVAEPIFPPELLKYRSAALTVPGEAATWERPVTLAELHAIKAAHPDAKLIVGNTEVGIEMKFGHREYPVLVGATHVPELNAIADTPTGVALGASVTLAAMLHKLEALCAARPAHETATFRAILGQLRWFAGAQIKNVAGIGGNICTASPISDLNPVYMAARAVFTVSKQGAPPRDIPARDFFLGYRKTAMEPEEVLQTVHIPFTAEHEYVREFKQAHRREDDIAIVNAGMRVAFARGPGADGAPGPWLVADVALAFGGVSYKTLTAAGAEAAFRGRSWSRATLAEALPALRADINMRADAPGGMVEFRQAVAASFLFKFFVEVSAQMEREAEGFAHELSAKDLSAAQPYARPPTQGLQYTDAAEAGSILGEPYRHASADLQVTGEAKYTDDLPPPPGLLHAAVVTSTVPHAKLLGVDASAAVAMQGVAGYFGADDVPGGNDIGPVLHDEECFASAEVTCVGQIIGVVVAETEALARAAARAVKVEYEPLPAVLSIEDAIAAGSEIEGWGHRVECGDAAACFASGECDHVLEGESAMGGQEHFYLEPHGCLVIPGEHDEILTYASTQALTKHQIQVAHVLGIDMHKVIAKTKRIGGGFGGKETRSAYFNAAAAVPAYLLQRPVRLILDRDEDMAMSGTRHPFLGKYKLGFTKEGRLLALEADLYNNAGNSLDLSHAIMDRALLHIDNCYKIPHVTAQGHVMRTNIPSNTAFRGFGGPQGMLLMEMWLDRVAKTVGRPLTEVRALNLYQEGDITHFGQALERCHIQRCWDEVMRSSEFEARSRAVAEFNAQHRWRKRGIAILPTKFGISFTTKFLNQAGALVHVYTDGSVLITHGGVEMGQGLHTKVCQVAAHSLGVPLAKCFIAETSTDKVPNSSPSAASASSDLYGMAVLKACEELKARLAPYRAQLGPDAAFAEVAKAAYMDRVDLCCHGWYSTPGIEGFGSKRPFKYFCYGATASEVEVDALTGDFQTLRSDLVMDVGTSINPAIDIGQVEGGFVQGLGWLTIEELVWGDKAHPWVRPGHLQTKGPGTYKIPSSLDIPADFRVSLLSNAPNPEAVVSSKAVGEPPFFLASSVFFAIKDALYAARAEAGLTEHFTLNSPATPEKIRMACADDLTAPFAPPDFVPKASV